jgi:hypothetical protein
MWKSSAGVLLTARPSTLFSGLHHFRASRRAQRKSIREVQKGRSGSDIDVSEWSERLRGCRKLCSAREEGERSVPLRRPLKMDFDHLLRIGDIEPSAVSFPSVGDDLN